MAEFNPREVAETLRKAMKGLGTDDKTLIRSITALSNEQLQIVRQSFSKDLGRDLIKDIKSETSGDYERIIAGLVYTRAEFDAKQLNKAIKGLGTDEDVIVETLCHRNNQELQEIKDAYLQLFGKTLDHDLRGDFSGKSKAFALGLINIPRQENVAFNPADIDKMVEKLYHAGEGRWGTDEDTFVQILCSSTQQYLRTLNEAYGRKHGHTLVLAVKREFSGFMAKGLEAMIKDHDEFYADLIFKACDGVGTDEDTLTRVVVGRRHRLRDINNKFMAKYERSIAHRVESEVSGNYGKVVVAILAAS